MVDNIQDLNLPNSVVARIIKEALPDGINVAKEARTAIARAASVFVIYLTTTTGAMAKKQNHKSLTPNNVFEALEEIEFETFIEPLKESLEAFREANKAKKAAKAADDKPKEAEGGNEVSLNGTEEIEE